MKVKNLTRAAIIAAIYALGTYFLGSFGTNIIQVRITEVLTVLPYFDPTAILGVTLGCFLANILGGLGPWDVFGGTLITLIAAILTSKTKNKLLALSWPILLNAFGVSAYLSVIFGQPYWFTVFSIFAGEFISIGVLGFPVMLYLEKNASNIGLDNQWVKGVRYKSADEKNKKEKNL